MSKKKKLNWGQTPWDNLNREELLREVWKMFSALQSANTVIQQVRDGQFYHRAANGATTSEEISKKINALAKEDGYWGRGTGARGFEKVQQAMARVEGYESEDVYRSFFRYADDLLFDRTKKLIGWGWAVCPKCGTMLGEAGEGETSVGKVCDWGKDGCGGIYRPLEWSDLSPEKAKEVG